MDKKLDKKLKGDPRFIPYCDKFDYDYARNYLNQKDSGVIDIDLSIKAYSTIIFNNYYKEFQNYYKEILDRTKLSNQKITKILISLSNRDLLLLTDKASKAIEKNNQLHFNDIMNFSIKSPFEELGNFNAQSGVETGHDALNTILNILKNSNNNYSKTEIAEEDIENFYKLLGFGSIYIVIKHAYDISIWEDYKVDYDNRNEILSIKSTDDELLRLNIIGEHRMESNIFASKQFTLSGYKKGGQLHDFFMAFLYRHRKAKRLKKITVSNGEIHYKLADGVEKDSTFKEIMTYAEVVTYYNFIGDEHLPGLDNLTLFNLLTVFSEIQCLFNKLTECSINDSVNIIEDYKSHCFYIKYSELIEYISKKTHFSKKQINQIVDLLTHKEGYYNIWERPLILIGDQLLPLLMPLIAPNTLRLIDYWLEETGFNIEDRGKLFERHLKKELKRAVSKKGYFVNILDKSLFKNLKNEKEEIDLIIELKNKILIAEVKCIKYPFDPRDYHNTYKRLNLASNQVKRKASFIQSNIKYFSSEFNESTKEIISLVITNYPIFSGLIINSIPIVDYSLIENYFFSGSLNRSKMSLVEMDIKNEDNIPPMIYYKDEDEFSNNIKSFLLNPPPIDIFRHNLIKEERQISLPNAKPKIVLDYMTFKNTIDI